MQKPKVYNGVYGLGSASPYQVAKILIDNGVKYWYSVGQLKVPVPERVILFTSVGDFLRSGSNAYGKKIFILDSPPLLAQIEGGTLLDIKLLSSFKYSIKELSKEMILNAVNEKAEVSVEIVDRTSIPALIKNSVISIISPIHTFLYSSNINSEERIEFLKGFYTWMLSDRSVKDFIKGIKEVETLDGSRKELKNFLEQESFTNLRSAFKMYFTLNKKGKPTPYPKIYKVYPGVSQYDLKYFVKSYKKILKRSVKVGTL